MSTTSQHISYDIFVSYSRYDRVWVHDWLFPRLQETPLSVCYDERGGDQNEADIVAIEQAITTSLKTLLILTPRWLESSAQFHEIVARHSDPANVKGRRVIPLLLEPCELPPRISMLDQVNFTNPDAREEELREVIAKVLKDKKQISEDRWPTAHDPNAPPHPPQPIRSKLLFQPGQSIGQNGRYEIKRKLGQGGFGTTYLALDKNMGTDCVVKRLVASTKAEGEQTVDSWYYFKQEIDILKELSQSLKEGIPRILDQIKEHNSFVMEYIDGKNFEDILYEKGGGPLPLPEALECAQKVGDILVRVHEHQPSILHRDIKPANILRGKDGRIWLIDFGLGKLQSREYGSSISSPALGTFFYMAPEQRQGQATERSDVYSLSATLYTLITGSPNYLKDAASPPSAQTINPLVPAELDELIAEGMSPDIQKRPHARFFLSRLRQIMTALSGQPPITTPNAVQIANLPDLAEWGEKYWEKAADWLYRTLPQDLRHTWSEHKVAEDLVNIRERHPSDRDAGLDEALSLIDPKHFGEQPRSIQVSPHQLESEQSQSFHVNLQELEFEVTSPTLLPSQTFILKNTGRRYIRASIKRPDWLVINEQLPIRLLPGKEKSITVTVRDRHRPGRRKVRDTITILYGVIALRSVKVVLKQPYIKRAPVLVYMGILGVLLVIGLWVAGIIG